MCIWCREQTTDKKYTSLIRAIHDVETRYVELESVLEDLRDDQLPRLKACKESIECYDFVKLYRTIHALGPEIVPTARLAFRLLLVSYRRRSLHLIMMLRRSIASSSPSRPRAQRIVSPPGRRLLRIAEFFFSAKTVTFTFKPLIADWQFEYFEALKEKRGKWHLRMMTVRYYWYYAKACGLSKVAKFFKGFAKQ